MELYPDGKPYDVTYDLHNCADEPIHLIRYVQGHAVLLAFDRKTHRVKQYSSNVADRLGYTLSQLARQTIHELLPNSLANQIAQAVREDKLVARRPYMHLRANGNEIEHWNIIGYVSGPNYVLEFEPADKRLSEISFLDALDHAVESIQRCHDNTALCPLFAEEIRTLTEFDRVMIYRFDEAANGEVIAEARRSDLPPFLHLRYPASDIPAQARALFLRNEIRTIADVQAMPNRIVRVDATDDPLDLTLSVARAVSPLHLEYLANMGVAATMSIAITVDGELWGLIACHHYSPRLIDYRIRRTIRFMGRIVSSRLHVDAAQKQHIGSLKADKLRIRLVDRMSENWDISDGLHKSLDDLLDLTNARGVAWKDVTGWHTHGITPDKEELEDLTNWLVERDDAAFYHTHHLVKDYPQGESIKDRAAGILAMHLSQVTNEYLIWFRPEVVREVRWGGDPNKSVVVATDGARLSPRKSFEAWKESVYLESVPWQEQDIASALALQTDIKEIILNKYQEIRKLNEKITEAYDQLQQFSYTVSHDLRAPLRSIEGFAQILKEDYEAQIDSYGKSVIDTIVQSANKMDRFIQDILHIAQLDKNQLSLTQVDVRSIIDSTWAMLAANESPDRQLELVYASPLPMLYADNTLIKQVLNNLISNAIKYTRNRPDARVEVGGAETDKEVSIYIKDNGIGFEMNLVDKAFDVFSRLVREDEYEGTGIGLAIVKRVINRHQGRIQVESTPGQGTIFYLHFPKQH